MDKKDIRKALDDAKSAMGDAEKDLESLRARVEELERAAEAAEAAGQGGMTKREFAQTAWVAPVVLAVTLPNATFAQAATSPVGPTTTVAPTTTTTGAPTTTPAPTTPAPTSAPTTPAPTLISDARLKRDVVHVATLDTGVKLYSFRYLWCDTAYVGVLAQDLIGDARFGTAVSVSSAGYYQVDYRTLGLRMATLDEWRDAGLSSVALRPASRSPLAASAGVSASLMG